MRVAFVYPNPRRRLAAAVAAGEAPDTGLLGQNHLHEHGIESFVHDPALRRRDRRSGLGHRLTWNLRELTLPWELDQAELAVTPLANLFPLVARLRRRLRIVLVSYHLAATFARSSGPRRRLLRAALGAAAHIVCTSSAGRERLVALSGIDPGKVSVALLGIDERFWTPSPRAEDGYVLTVGRDLARDYATFVRAVEGLPVRAVVVAGPANVAGLELPANVDLRLDIGPRELCDLYRGAACVVVPIRREGYRFGTESSGTIALLEAMACGRAVVVSERGPVADYVRPGETALTVPAEDPGALRTAIDRVLADPELAGTLAEAGRRSVEDGLTTRHLAARLAPILREVAR